MLIHALGREKLPTLSWGLQVSSKCYFLPVGRRSRVFVSIFLTPAAKYILNRNLAGRNVALYVHQRGVGDPNELDTFIFTAMSLISSNKQCGAKEITPLLIRDLLEELLKQMLPKTTARNPFFPENRKGQKQKFPKHWAHIRPTVSMAKFGWYLRILNFQN